ncbi:MAG: MogA/MoaB family molybdenum cofactor biosynthesis protein [Longimicrobiales bacterium]|nr:MogA/MoaB family molybdenum cofactor biosynthesis protein [Longimicrobiales bacterium]
MTEARGIRVGVLTVSDSCAAGLREDRSGEAICAWARGLGYDVVTRGVVPDDTGSIAAALLDWCDELGLDVVLSTGGTGLGPRDVTPEATRSVLEREAPGIAEEIRLRGREKTPYAALSRGLAGVRGATLVVNLPGGTGGVLDGLTVLGPMVAHAVALLRGEDAPHAPPSARGPTASEGGAA